MYHFTKGRDAKKNNRYVENNIDKSPYHQH